MQNMEFLQFRTCFKLFSFLVLFQLKIYCSYVFYIFLMCGRYLGGIHHHLHLRDRNIKEVSLHRSKAYSEWSGLMSSWTVSTFSSQAYSAVSRKVCKYQLHRSIRKLEKAQSDADFNVKYLHIFCVPDKFWLFLQLHENFFQHWPWLMSFSTEAVYQFCSQAKILRYLFPAVLLACSKGNPGSNCFFRNFVLGFCVLAPRSYDYVSSCDPVVWTHTKFYFFNVHLIASQFLFALRNEICKVQLMLISAPFFIRYFKNLIPSPKKIISILIHASQETFQVLNSENHS